jgi:uncharacterized membrane protein (UPF0182 family)
MLLVYTVAQVLPEVLWFQELRQTSVYSRTVSAQVQLYLLAAIPAAGFVGANLALALRRTAVLRSRAGVLGLVAAALVTGSLFGSAVRDHWQVHQLWLHRKSFGSVDPIHGKDAGFYVFSLPFERLVWGVLLCLVLVTCVAVAVVHLARGTLRLRPAHANFGAQVHLACLLGLALVLVAWRLRLHQYELLLGERSTSEPDSFAGAGYVDVTVRSPGYLLLAVLVLVLAVACVAAPFVVQNGRTRLAIRLLAVPGALLAIALTLVAGVLPALVQRFVVDPNPLLSEEPYLAYSIAGTRAGLGLDDIEVRPYSPTGSFTAADFPAISKRVANVPVWDTWVLEARMRQLVTDPPYFQPGQATLDVAQIGGRQHPTVVSARQLDLGQVPESAHTWRNDRLAFTHGLGRIQFSGTDIERSRAPRLMDSGLGVEEPRIYFGDLPEEEGRAASDHESPFLTPTTDQRLADSPWVLVNTRRPEIDLPAADAQPRASYHYRGTGGIPITDWVRRAAFAFALGSSEMLLSDDITAHSRLLLHRDVHDRLDALAPFLTWDAEAVPLTTGGRIVFVVEGYTTSDAFPYAEQVDLAGSRVSYARGSVRATVDAFSGRVDLYLTDDADPVARAWAEIYPDLFRPAEEFPTALRHRIRYPMDLFAAQAAAYERFHVTAPAMFASAADAWSRPLALSGPIDVAGDLSFDESDEDDLRFTLQPGYLFAAPPGETDPRLLVRTYYTPQRAQNLVASLTGWVDREGRAQLVSQTLARDPVTLGPAQMSRLTFATKRVGELLGVRNLEIRDLARSSLDTVILGRPRVLLLPGGILQIQSLYEGSKGPGAARLIGVTVFLNGRVGLGPDIESAIRQALNEPPRIEVLAPPEPVVVGRRVELAFRAENARRQQVTITSPSGRETATRRVASGRGTVAWTPSEPGPVTLRVEVLGLDGTSESDTLTFSVLSPPPSIRFVDRPPRNAVVGQPVRVSFRVKNGRSAVAEVSTRFGIDFSRDYLLRGRTAIVNWTPRTAGRTTLIIRARGEQGQLTRKRVAFTVDRREPEVPPPTIELLRAPDHPTVGREARFSIRAEDCLAAVAQIEAPDGEVRTWQFVCPARRARFTWTPTEPGSYVLTATSTGSSASSQLTTTLTVRDP